MTSTWSHGYSPLAGMWMLSTESGQAYFPSEEDCLSFGEVIDKAELAEIEAKKQADRAHEILCS